MDKVATVTLPFERAVRFANSTYLLLNEVVDFLEEMCGYHHPFASLEPTDDYGARLWDWKIIFEGRQNRAVFCFVDPQHAVLFKLRFGGNV